MLYRRGLPRVPFGNTVVKILHDRFGLNWRAFNTARLHFYQARFNDKRMWVARLLVQCLSEDYLVVSVDESSFSTSQMSRRRWQPKLHSELILEQRHRELRRQASQLPSAVGAAESRDAEQRSSHMHQGLQAPSTEQQGLYESPAPKRPQGSEQSTPLTAKMKRLAVLSAQRSERQVLLDTSRQGTSQQQFESPFQPQSSPCNNMQADLVAAQQRDLGLDQAQQEPGAQLSVKEEMVLLHYQGNVRPNTEYTLSLTAAMSQDKVVGLQLIEGGNDATLFENFLFKVLARLRSDPATA